jgi:MFS family permease
MAGMMRDRSLLALLVAELVSSLGSQFTALALPWFVLVTTGSPTKMGLVFAVELVPVAVLGIPAGSLVQRLGARTSMLIADGARAPIVAAIPLLHLVGWLSFGVILVLAALVGMFSCAYFTCQRLILPAVVGEDERALAQANSLVEGSTNITQLVVPALAGVAIAFLGAANVMWLDAGSFVLSFALVAALVMTVREVDGEGESGGILAGLRYLRHDALLARASLSSLVFGFLFRILTASFPVLAYEQYHRNARVAGLLLSVMGAGQVVGSLASFRLVTRLPPLRMAAFAVVGTAAPLWLLVPHVPVVVVGLALAICGASIPMINAPYLGMLSVRVPNALRGKVLQSIITINQLAGPLGYVVAGPIFVHAGLHVAYAIVAGLATFASANFILAVLPAGGEVAQEAA